MSMRHLNTYYIETYGCQMNVRDSETIAGILENRGASQTNDVQNADIIIFNTCCIRDHAERKVFGNIGALKALKEERPDIVIAVCGCMMQQKQVANKLFRRFPFVDLVFGTNVLHKFSDMLGKVLLGERLCVISENYEDVIEGLPSKHAPGHSAFVNITFGCNNFCTYCIVPYVRGRERSRKPEDIINEVRYLSQQGYTEITLLGQNVNSYGKTLDQPIDFAELLRLVHQVEGIERIRFMTSHPKDLSDRLIDAMAEYPKVCHHIHLPLQSGSDAILKAMNRRYTSENYMKLVEKLRKKVPDVELTTDIIVGFPGETEEDFQSTLSVVQKVGYAAAYSFKYSPRDGTVAASMPAQIDEGIKSERLQRLNSLLAQTTEANNAKYIGKSGEVLVEGSGTRDGISYAFGKLSNFKMVYFPGEADLIGHFVKVEINDIRNNSLYGTRRES